MKRKSSVPWRVGLRSGVLAGLSTNVAMESSLIPSLPAPILCAVILVNERDNHSALNLGAGVIAAGLVGDVADP